LVGVDANANNLSESGRAYIGNREAALRLSEENAQLDSSGRSGRKSNGSLSGCACRCWDVDRSLGIGGAAVIVRLDLDGAKIVIQHGIGSSNAKISGSSHLRDGVGPSSDLSHWPRSHRE